MEKRGSCPRGSILLLVPILESRPLHFCQDLWLLILQDLLPPPLPLHLPPHPLPAAMLPIRWVHNALQRVWFAAISVLHNVFAECKLPFNLNYSISPVEVSAYEGPNNASVIAPPQVCPMSLPLDNNKETILWAHLDRHDVALLWGISACSPVAAGQC